MQRWDLSVGLLLTELEFVEAGFVQQSFSGHLAGKCILFALHLVSYFSVYGMSDSAEIQFTKALRHVFFCGYPQATNCVNKFCGNISKRRASGWHSETRFQGKKPLFNGDLTYGLPKEPWLAWNFL